MSSCGCLLMALTSQNLIFIQTTHRLRRRRTEQTPLTYRSFMKDTEKSSGESKIRKISLLVAAKLDF